MACAATYWGRVDTNVVSRLRRPDDCCQCFFPPSYDSSLRLGSVDIMEARRVAGCGRRAVLGGGSCAPPASSWQ